MAISEVLRQRIAQETAARLADQTAAAVRSSEELNQENQRVQAAINQQRAEVNASLPPAGVSRVRDLGFAGPDEALNRVDTTIRAGNAAAAENPVPGIRFGSAEVRTIIVEKTGPKFRQG